MPARSPGRFMRTGSPQPHPLNATVETPSLGIGEGRVGQGDGVDKSGPDVFRPTCGERRLSREAPYCHPHPPIQALQHMRREDIASRDPLKPHPSRQGYNPTALSAEPSHENPVKNITQKSVDHCTGETLRASHLTA